MTKRKCEHPKILKETPYRCVKCGMKFAGIIKESEQELEDILQNIPPIKTEDVEIDLHE